MSTKTDRRPALGRGLSALIPESPARPAAESTSIAANGRDFPAQVDLDRIDPNPRQPRVRFDEQKLEELAASIRSNGLVQPVVVRRKADRYELVAGERRWRAAQMAGLLKIAVVVSDVDDARMLEVALIENIQREDLNPIEAAQAYKRLGDESGLTQEQIATAVGKDRATIANLLRLLKLPDAVRERVATGELSMGHARALLAIESPDLLTRAAAEVVAKGLSVRATEAMARRVSAPPPAPTSSGAAPDSDVHTRHAEERLRVALGTRVAIRRQGQGGKLEIEFVSEQELIRLFDLLLEK
ncbi:MAG: ParB/RepB/Spo0J family partition protein [Acidobacteria bacterium]|nr:ParB/RepB/Spo0J family partition protein [Acidobacteriota bacterium]